MKRFLIVKTSSIGDVLQSLHLLDYLKKRVPSCQVDWVVEKSIAPLLRSHPTIDKVIEVDTRVWRKNLISSKKEMGQFRRNLRSTTYDALFDLQGNTKSGLITAFAKAGKKVGYNWKEVPEKPNYFVTNVHACSSSERSVRRHYLHLLESYFGGDKPLENQSLLFNLTAQEKCRLQRLEQFGFQRPRFMICFGSNWKNKRLSERTLEEFLALVEERYSPTFFFIFGNEEEKILADRLERTFSHCSHAVGRLSLPLWQRFMDLVEGVIAMDSAALHLCATTKTPSFSLFGPSSALAYKPLGEQHRAFQGTCPYGVQFAKRCPELRSCPTGACLKDLRAVELFDPFTAFWDRFSQARQEGGAPLQRFKG